MTLSPKHDDDFDVIPIPTTEQAYRNMRNALRKQIEHLERQLAEANAALGTAAEYGDQQLYTRAAELEAIRKAAEAAIEAFRDMRKTAKATGESGRAAEARKLKQESFVLAMDILNELCVKARTSEPSR